MNLSGAAVVSGRGARRARRGHPWIFRDDVLTLDASAGDAVRVSDRDGRFACWAACSPSSRIRLRRLTTEDVLPDDAFVSAQVTRALALRTNAGATGCSRLVHADADSMPGLTIDRYGAHVVVQSTTHWADRVAPFVASLLAERLGIESALLRADAPVRKLESLPQHQSGLLGTTPDEILCEEGGVPRIVDPRKGHKTGLYLDQQENHAGAPALLAGSVLDLFCGEGGFSLPLAASGCDVLAIDQAGAGLDRARRAMERAQPPGRLEFERANVFDVVARMAEEGMRFDGAVVDPPPFTRTRGRRGEAARAYRDLHRRVLRLVRPGGRILTFCCSFAVDEAAFEAAVRAGAEESGVRARVLARPGASADHPECIEIPESRYLKGLLLELAPGPPSMIEKANRNLVETS